MMAANRIFAYCGLDCAECPAYIATQAGDEARLAETATQWSSDDYPVSAAEVPCDGCVQQGGRLFKWCRDCPIRACCIEKGYVNCAYCDDLPCDKLAKAPPGTTERLLAMQQELRGGLI
jgi:hypothetical protein